MDESPQYFTDIPFKWGGSSPLEGFDCFTLASYARMAQGRSPLPDHGWVYEQFPEDAFPPDLMVELCQDALIQVVRSPIHLDIVALRGESISLGTCFGAGVDRRILHFSPLGRSVLTPIKTIIRSRLILGVFEVVTI